MMRTGNSPFQPRVACTRALLGASLLSVFLLPGCQTPQQNSEPKSEKSEQQLTLEKFRELLAKGSLQPVQETEQDPYNRTSPDMDEDVFGRAAEEARQQLDKPQSQPESAQPESAQPESVRTEPAPPASAPTEPAPTEPAPNQPIGAGVAVPSYEFPQNPYLEFGKRIQVWQDAGLITKPFPLRVGTGKKLLDLLTAYGNFPIWKPEEGAQTRDKVRIDLLEKWDMELLSDTRAVMVNEGNPVPIADWLVITSGFEQLKEVESFINIFAAGVPQIEIEAKIVEVTTSDSLDLGVRPLDLSTPIFGFPDHTFVRSFTYNLPNASSISNADSLLTLSSVQNSLEFNAVLEALATFQNVAIQSRPKIAVREGARADIQNTQKLPYYSVGNIAPDGKVAAGLMFEEVGIKLYVIPRVVGTRTVALSIDVEASQESGSATTFTLQNGQTISNPIITKRSARTVVYLEPGQAVILGGLISERKVEQENKVPFLGDIPLLGYLFRSKLQRKEQSNVLFFIRPRILQGSDLHREF
ncbi:MAG: type secretion system protein GspD [Planctomycetota bacterium]